MINMFSKIYLEDVLHASAASVPFMSLCKRFLLEDSVLDFLVKFLNICFALLLSLEKDAEFLQEQHKQNLAMANDPRMAKKKMLALPASTKKSSPPARGKLSKAEQEKRLKEQEEDLDRRLKKVNTVEIRIKI